MFLRTANPQDEGSMIRKHRLVPSNSSLQIRGIQLIYVQIMAPGLFAVPLTILLLGTLETDPFRNLPFVR